MYSYSHKTASALLLIEKNILWILSADLKRVKKMRTIKISNDYGVYSLFISPSQKNDAVI